MAQASVTMNLKPPISFKDIKMNQQYEYEESEQEHDEENQEDVEMEENRDNSDQHEAKVAEPKIKLEPYDFEQVLMENLTILKSNFPINSDPLEMDLLSNIQLPPFSPVNGQHGQIVNSQLNNSQFSHQLNHHFHQQSMQSQQNDQAFQSSQPSQHNQQQHGQELTVAEILKPYESKCFNYQLAVVEAFVQKLFKRQPVVSNVVNDHTAISGELKMAFAANSCTYGSGKTKETIIILDILRRHFKNNKTAFFYQSTEYYHITPQKLNKDAVIVEDSAFDHWRREIMDFGGETSTLWLFVEKKDCQWFGFETMKNTNFEHILISYTMAAKIFRERNYQFRAVVIDEFDIFMSKVTQIPPILSTYFIPISARFVDMLRGIHEQIFSEEKKAPVKKTLTYSSSLSKVMQNRDNARLLVENIVSIDENWFKMFLTNKCIYRVVPFDQTPVEIFQNQSDMSSEDVNDVATIYFPENSLLKGLTEHVDKIFSVNQEYLLVLLIKKKYTRNCIDSTAFSHWSQKWKKDVYVINAQNEIVDAFEKCRTFNRAIMIADIDKITVSFVFLYLFIFVIKFLLKSVSLVGANHIVIIGDLSQTDALVAKSRFERLGSTNVTCLDFFRARPDYCTEIELLEDFSAFKENEFKSRYNFRPKSKRQLPEKASIANTEQKPKRVRKPAEQKEPKQPRTKKQKVDEVKKVEKTTTFKPPKTKSQVASRIPRQEPVIQPKSREFIDDEDENVIVKSPDLGIFN